MFNIIVQFIFYLLECFFGLGLLGIIFATPIETEIVMTISILLSVIILFHVVYVCNRKIKSKPIPIIYHCSVLEVYDLAEKELHDAVVKELDTYDYSTLKPLEIDDDYLCYVSNNRDRLIINNDKLDRAAKIRLLTPLIIHDDIMVLMDTCYQIITYDCTKVNKQVIEMVDREE